MTELGPSRARVKAESKTGGRREVGYAPSRKLKAKGKGEAPAIVKGTTAPKPSLLKLKPKRTGPTPLTTLRTTFKSSQRAAHPEQQKKFRQERQASRKIRKLNRVNRAVLQQSGLLPSPSVRPGPAAGVRIPGSKVGYIPKSGEEQLAEELVAGLQKKKLLTKDVAQTHVPESVQELTKLALTSSIPVERALKAGALAGKAVKGIVQGSKAAKAEKVAATTVRATKVAPTVGKAARATTTATKTAKASKVAATTTKALRPARKLITAPARSVSPKVGRRALRAAAASPLVPEASKRGGIELGGGKLGHNARREAEQMAIYGPVALTLTAKSAVEAPFSGKARKQLAETGKSIVETSPLVAAVRGDFKKAGKLAEEYPLSTAFGALGGAGLVGRGASLGVRTATKPALRGAVKKQKVLIRKAHPKLAQAEVAAKATGRVEKTLAARPVAAAAHRRRTPLQLAGGLTKRREASPNLGIALIQRAADEKAVARQLQKRVPPKSKTLSKKAARKQARERLAEGTARVTPTAFTRERNLNRYIDRELGVANTLHRADLNKTMAEVSRTIKGERRIGPGHREKLGRLSRQEQDAIFFTGQNVVRNSRTAKVDLGSFIDSARRGGGSPATIARAEKLLADTSVFSSPKVKRAVEGVREVQKREEGELVAIGREDPARFERARLIPYAQTHMGAKHRSPVVNGKVKGSRRWMVQDAQTKTWRTVTNAEIRAHMKRNKVDVQDPIFFPHTQRAATAGAYTKGAPMRTVPRLRKRTGKSLSGGKTRTEADVLVEHAAMTVRARHNWGTVGKVMGETAWRDGHGEPRRFSTIGRAHEEAAKIVGNGGPDLVPIRPAGFFAKKDFTERVNKLIAEQGDEFSDLLVRDLQDALGEAQKPGKGEVYLVPREVLKRIEGHMQKPGGFLRGVDIYTGIFKSTVLPFSPRWIANNLITNVALAAQAGVTPLDWLRGQKLYKRLQKQDPKLAREVRARIGHGFIGSEAHIAKAGASFSGPIGKAVVSAYRSFREGPLGGIPKGARRLSQGGFQANQVLENFVRTAALGKMAKRRALQELGAKWVDGVTMTDRLMDDLESIAKNKREVESLGERVAEMLGDYSRFSPNERAAWRRFVPFWSWLRFTTRFTLYTLPAKSPYKAAILAELARTKREEAERLGIQPDYFKGVIGTRLGALPTKQLNPLRSALPFQPVSEWPSNLNPALTDSLALATGFDMRKGGFFESPVSATSFKGRPGQVKNGKAEFGAPRPNILDFAIFSKFPPYRVAKNIAEEGRPAYDTSTLWKPQPKTYKSKRLNRLLKKKPAQVLLEDYGPVSIRDTDLKGLGKSRKKELKYIESTVKGRTKKKSSATWGSPPSPPKPPGPPIR